MLWWILFVLIAVLLYVRIWKPQQYWKERNVPHEKPIPIVGNMLAAFLRRISFAENMLQSSQKFKNYRYYGFYQLWMPTLMIHDIDLIKQITIKDFDSFTDRIMFASEKLDPLFTNSLLMVKGQKWKHIRSTLSPSFTSSKMKLMFNLMSECAEHFIEYFLKNAEPNKHTTVEMKDIFSRYANDVIATCAFGLKCDSLTEQNNGFYVMGKRAIDFDGIKGFKMFGYTVNKTKAIMEFFKVRLHELEIQDYFRNLFMTTMETREKDGIIRPDMIHLLMQARKGNLKYEESANEDTGFATAEESHMGKEKDKNIDLSDDDLVAQALVFFFAGFDSSSTLLSHCAHELAINPDIQEKLQSEVDETLLNCKDHKITYDAIAKMKYMDMVISETLRKWSPAVVTTRVCTKRYVIEPVLPEEQQLVVEKGDTLHIHIYAIHHNPEYFPNPERFDPERFSDENKINIKPMTFIPFGVGPRNCIASRFALLETKTLLVYLLSKFNFVVDEKTQLPLKLSKTNFNMTAENGFWLGLQRRTIK